MYILKAAGLALITALVVELLIYLVLRLRNRGGTGKGVSPNFRDRVAAAVLTSDDLVDAAEAALSAGGMFQPGTVCQASDWENWREAWLRLLVAVKRERAVRGLANASETQRAFALRELHALGEATDLPLVTALRDESATGAQTRGLATLLREVLRGKNETAEAG